MQRANPCPFLTALLLTKNTLRHPIPTSARQKSSGAMCGLPGGNHSANVNVGHDRALHGESWLELPARNHFTHIGNFSCVRERNIKTQMRTRRKHNQAHTFLHTLPIEENHGRSHKIHESRTMLNVVQNVPHAMTQQLWTNTGGEPYPTGAWAPLTANALPVLVYNWGALCQTHCKRQCSGKTHAQHTHNKLPNTNMASKPTQKH